MAQVDFIACPVCSRPRPLGTKTGRYTPGEGADEASNMNVIQFRQAQGGPGRGHKTKGTSFGFPIVGGLTMEQAMKDPNYAGIAETLKSRILEVVKSYASSGLVSKEELDSLYPAAQ